MCPPPLLQMDGGEYPLAFPNGRWFNVSHFFEKKSLTQLSGQEEHTREVASSPFRLAPLCSVGELVTPEFEVSTLDFSLNEV